jgi:hypothetical protein
VFGRSQEPNLGAYDIHELLASPKIESIIVAADVISSAI